MILHKISDLDFGSPWCPKCEGSGWVCENRPDSPWPDACDCGAGVPCSCNPLTTEEQS